jgi:hypothetical protein
MATTGSPWNLPYPIPTDLVRDGADAIKDLAEDTAAALTTAANNLNASNLNSGTVPLARLPYQLDSGVVTGNVPAGTVSQTTVTFTSGRFAVAPVVVAQKHGESALVRSFNRMVSVSTATTTSFTLTRANSDDSSRSIPASWIAVQS